MTSGKTDRAVAGWLFTCAAFVLGMVVVGGVTRLTRSGLSIVEWQPIAGILPPIGPEAWERAFAAYRETPEARLENHWMALADFKSIYLMEYAHRLLGRVTGLVFLLPLVVFVWQRRLSRAKAATLAGLFALGGLQGALGWYMVKSGLVDAPRVSPYRLTSHLLVALVLFSCLVWAGLSASDARPVLTHDRPGLPQRVAWACLGLLGLTVAWGGLTAGLRAGAVCPTFPTMCGELVPPGVMALSPGIRNLFENALTVQLVHRALALSSAVAVLLTARLVWSSPLRMLGVALVALLSLQILLGAATVVSHVPVALAAMHQANAVLTLGACVILIHALGRVDLGASTATQQSMDALGTPG